MTDHQAGSKPRTASATIKDVARLAGVSLGSVSRVLNDKASVTAEVRTRVLSAIDALGYQPNTVAQSMRSQVSRTVGCIIRDINIPGLAAFVRAAHDIFMEQGYALLLSNSEGRAERERELVSVMAARRADALLIGHYSELDPDLEAVLKRANIPVVLVDRERPDWADAVMVNHQGAVRRATERLIQLGHRRIALLTGRDTLYPARERIAGFLKAYEALGLSCDPSLVRSGSFEAEFGFEQTSLLISSSNRPTAIIAGGIEMLPGVVRALRLHGLAVPRDISLVGTLNSDLAELHEPPISVEHWDYAEVGRIAARFALERMRDSATLEPRRLLIPSDFMLRESCSAPPSV
ncbi:LacI family DNA-binding transcriptional regulator [Microvirga calopogonii]|uniref:LacI family DNA-binding transcriptional regulator n=1 Tax=Microvirga calopogonii TaxID=2078013 RepID=UPI000E0CE776|nr:substrate-binding domain-containing protein [Microvirga calopogonii]